MWRSDEGVSHYHDWIQFYVEEFNKFKRGPDSGSSRLFERWYYTHITRPDITVALQRGLEPFQLEPSVGAHCYGLWKFLNSSHFDGFFASHQSYLGQITMAAYSVSGASRHGSFQLSGVNPSAQTLAEYNAYQQKTSRGLEVTDKYGAPLIPFIKNGTHLEDLVPKSTQGLPFLPLSLRQQADTYTGIQLLYPFAAMVLCACAVRSLLRYRRWDPHAWTHAIQLVLGFGLSLLWLLDRDVKYPQYDEWSSDSPAEVGDWAARSNAFKLATSGWSSWIVLGVYMASSLFTTALAVSNLPSVRWLTSGVPPKP